MSELQKLGKRLNKILVFIKQNRPDLEERFTNHVIPLFIKLIDSQTSPDLEERIITGMNGWIDVLEMELKGLFENK